MTTVRALRIIRWAALGLIGLILLGTVVFLEFGRKGEPRAVADNAMPGTMAVAGASIGGTPKPTLACEVVRERATGIEPAFSAWEADVLPLNYARGWRPHYPLTPLELTQVALAFRHR